MSVQTPNILQDASVSSFIGLQSYSEAQADRFFGRDEEISHLTKLIQSNTLTIVFGKSGTGKTSLLNAGVFPKLRRDYSLPFRIRLEFAEDSPDLIAQVKQVLKTEIDKYGFKVEHYPASETLWEYFHREPLWRSVTPILVFDQFEEIFTLAKKSSRFRNTELELFWEELADLIENSIPDKLKDKFLNHKESIGYDYKHQKIKILFAFREEFLPEFESITTKIPSIKYSRFRLMQMNGSQAYEVITKTWKKNIDPAEAKQIVGFFAHESDIDKGYQHVSEIEPSLLSQVCSYIDRERIMGGHEKISAAMLNKYPKDIILRSIYNEVLIESNEAIPADTNQPMAKPVNRVKEFIEDKLITDEGYRTKYTLTPQDEIIRPGIEILKTKYYLREDGQSLELTHDVLVPIIKSDRENRRKEIALATARKKANRRSVFIIIFSLLAAGLIWYLVTRQAIQDKNDAIAATEKLKEQITIDSTKLAGLGDSIKLSLLNLKNLNKNRGGGNPGGDSSLSDGAESDSARLAGLESRYASLQQQYAELDFKKSALDTIIAGLNEKVNFFSGSQAKTATAYNELIQQINTLKQRFHADSMQLARNYDLLNRQFAEYRLRYPVPVWSERGTGTAVPDTSNSLRLNLFYSASKAEVPGNLKIYLIPDSSYNKKIIKDAKVYEIYCEDLSLDKAKGGKIARFSNKAYTFSNVPPGNYFIKICAYYGGYYTIRKKAAGIETSAKLDLSPPIR